MSLSPKLNHVLHHASAIFCIHSGTYVRMIPQAETLDVEVESQQTQQKYGE